MRNSHGKQFLHRKLSRVHNITTQNYSSDLFTLATSAHHQESLKFLYAPQACPKLFKVGIWQLPFLYLGQREAWGMGARIYVHCGRYLYDITWMWCWIMGNGRVEYLHSRGMVQRVRMSRREYFVRFKYGCGR